MVYIPPICSSFTLFWNPLKGKSVISVSLSPRHGPSSGCGWNKGYQYGGQLRIYWISSRGQPTRGCAPALGLDEVLTSPHRKSCLVMKHIHVPWSRTDPLVWPKQWERDMRFGTWNFRSLYRSGSLTAVARELARYKLDWVAKGKWGGGGDRVRPRDYTFLVWNRTRKSSIGKSTFCISQNSTNS